MKIVIAGGTGLIGSALVQLLTQDNHQVIVLTRAPERAPHAGASIQYARWDGRTALGWAQHAEGADALVHLAGEPIAPLPWWWRKRREKIRASRVQAGQALVDAVQQAKNKPRAVLQASAIGYYGLHGDETLDERAAAGKDFLASVCVDWENATQAVEALGVRRVVFRTGLVLARDGGVLPLMALPFRFFVGGKLGGGRQWMSWIHIADESAALKFLIERQDARGAFNLTAPHPTRNQDFARALGQALGRPSLIPTPGFAMKIPFGEMADLMLLNGQRVAPAHLQRLGFEFRYPTLAPALAALRL